MLFKHPTNLPYQESMMNIIPKCSGTGLELKKGQKLKIIDIEGFQVSDFFCFFKEDHEDYLSSGRTFDYNDRICYCKSYNTF